MSDVHDEWRGDGFEGVEDKLRRNQPVPSEHRLDDIKRTVLARDHGRGRSAGGFRRSFATSALVAGLVLGGGGALVLAQTGGDGGGGSGSGNAAVAQYGHHRCPRGEHRDKNGQCVPNRGHHRCPRGEHRDKNGHCVHGHGQRGANRHGGAGRNANRGRSAHRHGRERRDARRPRERLHGRPSGR